MNIHILIQNSTIKNVEICITKKKITVVISKSFKDDHTYDKMKNFHRL